MPPAIARTYLLRSDIEAALYHQDITPLAHSRRPLARRRPHHHYNVVCVCVCVCVCVIYVYSTLNIFHTIPVVEYLRLPDPLLSQLYAHSDVSLDLRQQLSITLYKSLTSSTPAFPLKIPSI